MEENYLLGLFVMVIFSFVLFKKENKVPVQPDEKQRVSVSSANSSNATGVSKYLKEQEKNDLNTNVSGVEKYLLEKQEQSNEQAQNSVVSGVAKYLASKAETPVSGVSKYMARQAIQAKKIARENVSGVEKYLNNRV